MLELKQSSKLRNLCSVEKLRNSLDIYGQNFYLSFKGQKTYNTNLGAVMSLVVYCVFLFYIGMRGIILVTKQEIYTTTNQYVKNINYTDPEMLNFKDYGFDFAFRTLIPLTPQYGSFKVSHSKQKRDSVTNQMITEDRYLEFGACGNDTLNYPDQEEVKMKGFDEFFCLKNLSNEDALLGGNFYAMNFRQIQLVLERCENSTESDIVCAPNEEIDDFLNSNILQLVIVDSFFDYNDLHMPVKSYLEQRNFYYLSSDSNVFGILQFIPCFASMQQELLPISAPENIQFSQYMPILWQKIGSQQRGSGTKHFELSIRISDQQKEYVRTVYSFMDFLSDIGGLFSTIFVCGKLVVDLYLEKLYYAHLIGQLFQVEVGQGQGQGQGQGKLGRVEEFLKQEAQGEKGEFQNQLANEILARRSFTYTFKDILYKQFNLLYCCCCKSSNPKLKHQRLRKATLFKKAISKIETRFDAISLFESINQTKALSQVVFSKPQKFILKFQRNQVLSSESSVESDSYLDDLEYLNSVNPYTRLRFLAKIKGITRKFLTQNQRQGLDKRLLKGVFAKKSKASSHSKQSLKNRMMNAADQILKNKVVPERRQEAGGWGEEEKEDLGKKDRRVETWIDASVVDEGFGLQDTNDKSKVMEY